MDISISESGVRVIKKNIIKKPKITGQTGYNQTRQSSDLRLDQSLNKNIAKKKLRI